MMHLPWRMVCRVKYHQSLAWIKRTNLKWTPSFIKMQRSSIQRWCSLIVTAGQMNTESAILQQESLDLSTWPSTTDHIISSIQALAWFLCHHITLISSLFSRIVINDNSIQNYFITSTADTCENKTFVDTFALTASCQEDQASLWSIVRLFNYHIDVLPSYCTYLALLLLKSPYKCTFISRQHLQLDPTVDLHSTKIGYTSQVSRMLLHEYSIAMHERYWRSEKQSLCGQKTCTMGSINSRTWTALIYKWRLDRWLKEDDHDEYTNNGKATLDTEALEKQAWSIYCQAGRLPSLWIVAYLDSTCGWIYLRSLVPSSSSQ